VKNKIKIDQGPKCQTANFETATEMYRESLPKYKHRNKFLYILPKAQEIEQELTCVIISAYKTSAQQINNKQGEGLSCRIGRYVS
jgi:hypothetical protein